MRQSLGEVKYIIALARSLRSGSDDAFSSIWIEHSPVYRIVVTFTTPKEKSEFVRALDPKIRSYIHLQIAKRNRSSIEATLDELLSALRGAGAENFNITFDEQTDKFIVITERDDVAGEIRRLLPAALNNDVILKKGAVPKRHAAPSGLQPGDYLHGGFTSYDQASGTYPGCTWGYAVRWNGTAGILTAGHCGKDQPTRQYWDGANGHWVRIGSPLFIKHDINTKYDFQFHETTGYVNNGWIYYQNKYSRQDIQTMDISTRLSP